MQQTYEVRFCSHCATALQWMEMEEDGGHKRRLRCPACGWTHWNNPTPVLAAIVERDGQLLLARNALWKDRFFGLITGFMEAGETPEQGIAREVLEETGLEVTSTALVDVSDFQRNNQVLITYHVTARGQVRLSPELSEYQLIDPAQAQAWNTGTGRALEKWLRARGFDPVIFDRYARLREQDEAQERARAAAQGQGEKQKQDAENPPPPVAQDAACEVAWNVEVALEVDAQGLRCPQPILRAKKALNTLGSGQLLRVSATDAGSLQDFEAFARQSGNTLLAQHTDAQGVHYFVLRRR